MSAVITRLHRRFAQAHRDDPPRLQNDPGFTPLQPLRPAAVMIAVTERAEPGVLLTRRPQSMRSHAGQIAFPGGKLDAGEDAVTAALRETREELGIVPDAIRVIGTSDRFLTGTGYDITPVLGCLPPDLPLSPNPAEVEGWFEAPLEFLLDPANRVRKSMTYMGQTREYTEIMWQEHRIWGVTAAILANLAVRLGWDRPDDD